MLREPGDPSRIDDESPAIENGRGVIDRATVHAPGDTGAHLLADRVEESARGVASVLRAVAEAITVQDTSGRLVYANDAAARMLGFETPEALLAAPIADVVDRFELFDENGGPLSPLDLPGRLALAGREPPAMTVRFRIRGTGEERWSIVRSTALVDADGRPTLAINAFQDITSRVLGEREALASRERLGQLVEALPVIAWTTDHDGRIIGSNGRWSEYTGSEPAIGRPIVDDASIHPDDLPGLVAAWGAARRAGTTFEAATRLRRLDGDYRWHLVRAVPASRHEDAPTTWIGTSTDIDDEKRSEERSRLLADAAARLDESLELDDTVRTAAALAIPRLADVAVIDLVGPDGSVRRGAIHAADRALRGTAARLADYPSIPGSDGAMGSVMASGQTLVLDGIDETMLAARTKDGAHADILRALATRSAVAIPLVARGRTLGAMALIRSAGRPSFDVRDVEVAEELARRAALAIDNASLYTAEGAARRAAEEAATRTNQLQQLTKALAGATDRADVGRLVTGDTRSVLDAAAVGLYVTNRAGDVIEAVAIDGLPEVQVEGWQEVRLTPDGPLSAVIGGSHEWWVENLATDPASPAFSALADALGAGAVVLLPVGTTDRVRGILGLFWPEPHTWTSDERDFIRAAADLAGQALERVGLAESRERLVLELDAERERLASVAESEHARAAELNAVIRSMGEAILVCDADGRIRLANPAA
ncbi:MAG: PAS domain S-box protein, partial [Chloroflexota bacterium]